MSKDEKECLYYILKNCDVPWGDYGSILHTGMTGHLGRENGLLQLERTGPFVPPITDSGTCDFIITDDFRKKLEESGLTGFSFQPVVKKHIVKLDWHKWNRKLDEPPLFPSSGEPEDYILNRKHNPKLAEEIGSIWELVVVKKGQIERRKKENPTGWSDVDIYFIAETWPGVDFFLAEGVAYMYITPKAKKWFEENAGEWLCFDKALIA